MSKRFRLDDRVYTLLSAYQRDLTGDICMSKQRNRGVSKGEWLEAGLRSISKQGIASLTIEGLAKSLGIAKAGFYWHFKSRDDLLNQMLDYWTHEVTEVISENPQVLALEPKPRLTKTAEMILDYDLTRFEFAIRLWALSNQRAASAVKKVNRKRLDFIRSALSELGFKGDDLEARAMLFVCYQTCESTTFREIPRKRRRELITKRVELLTSE